MSKKLIEEVLYQIFQEEANASNKYKIFSEYSKNRVVKKVFSIIFLSEKIHAEKVRKLAMRSGLNIEKFVPNLEEVKVKDDKENLEDSIKLEIYESTNLFQKLALLKSEHRNKSVNDIIDCLNKVNGEHTKLLENIKNNYLESDEEISLYLCPTCGSIYLDDSLDKCKTCNGESRMFHRY